MLFILPARQYQHRSQLLHRMQLPGQHHSVLFIDESTNSPTSWMWSFGDGSTSTTESPSHTYTGAGTYTVTLTATNSAGSNTDTRDRVYHGQQIWFRPRRGFCCKCDVRHRSALRPVRGLFHELPDIVGLVVRRRGFIDIPEPLPHLYKCRDLHRNPHSDQCGRQRHDLGVRLDYGREGRPRVPVASFVAAEISGTAPLPVQFVDSSTNSPTSWVWSFGDGGSSTSQNPSHTYTSVGTYTVTLTATNAAGSNTDTETGYISVDLTIPVASFTANVTEGPEPLTVNFTDTSTNSPT